MHEDVLRLGRLMEDFERLAAAQQPGLLLDKRLVNVAKLARSRGQAFKEYYDAKGIRLMLDIDEALTYGDADLLGQVIDNLLSNALRYTDPGGHTILRVIEVSNEVLIEV